MGRRAAPDAQVDVTVIVVNWNNRDLLRTCLDSVFEQTSEVAFEVVCVDNGSADGSVAMIQAEFPQVRIICNTTNRGFIEANNQAIQSTCSRYVLLLNPDTVVLDRAIERIVRFADQNPDAGVFGGHVLNPDLTLQRSCFMCPSVLNMFLAATYLYKIFRRSRFFGRQFLTWWDYNDVRSVEAVSGCFELARREAVDQVGLMDPIYFVYGDDIDWGWRFRAAGWKVLYAPAPTIIHIGGQATKVMRRRFLFQLFASLLVFMRLHRSGPEFLFYRILLSGYCSARMVFWWLKAIAKSRDRKGDLGRARTFAIACSRSLFDWKGLLMNRSEFERELSRRKQERKARASSRLGMPAGLVVANRDEMLSAASDCESSASS